MDDGAPDPRPAGGRVGGVVDWFGHRVRLTRIASCLPLVTVTWPDPTESGGKAVRVFDLDELRLVVTAITRHLQHRPPEQSRGTDLAAFIATVVEPFG